MSKSGGRRARFSYAKEKVGYIPERGTCSQDGKRIYLRHEAKKVARALSRNTSEKLVEYRCPSGSGWHVGHDSI